MSSTLKALREELYKGSRPTQADYDNMIRRRRRELRNVTEQLARGDITAQTWADRFDSILLSGHSRAWHLGRHLAGDTSEFGEDDRLAGMAAKDPEGEYLNAFLGDLLKRDPRYFDEDGNLRSDAVMNRGNLYLGKMRGTANEAFVAASDEDEQFDWVLGGAEKHCEDCPRIAKLSPFDKTTLWTHPGQGDTECLGNCKCFIRRRSDRLTGFKAEGSKDGNVKSETAGPAPVSDAIDNNAGFPVGAVINQTGALIDSVHTDGALPETGFFTTIAQPDLGGWFDPKNVEIVINAFGPTKHMTTAHEIGHLLDCFGIGAAGRMSSPRAKVMKPWREAVKETTAFKHLQGLLAAEGTIDLGGDTVDIDESFKEHVAYLLRWEELWARSYAQFIATRTGDETMLRELNDLLDSEYQKLFNAQWEAKDFKAVAAAIVEVFVQLGWMSK